MSTFGGVYFTNKGRALQAKALTGVQLNFTRIGIGDGSLSGQAIQDLNALIHEVKSLPITTLKNKEGEATAGGSFSNQGLSTGFYYRELGLFAQDPTLGEILYCYGNAGALAEYIPADGGSDILEKTVNVIAIIGDAPNVSATLSSLIQVSSVNGQSGDVVLTAENVGAAPTSHTHDDRYYTETEIDTKFESVATSLTDMTKIPPYAVATGTANTYVVTLNPAPTSYVDGMGIVVKINVASTGASTLNVNGLGAKAILDSLGNPITSGGLKANTPYAMRYNGTSFILLGKGGGGNATADKLLTGYTATVDTGQITGTIPVNASQTTTLNITGSAKPTKVVPSGYTPGGTITAQLDVSLANKILQGNNIGGVTGTYNGKQFYATDITIALNVNDTYTVSGIPFTPKRIYIGAVFPVSDSTFYYPNFCINSPYYGGSSTTWQSMSLNSSVSVSVPTEPTGGSFTLKNTGTTGLSKLKIICYEE